MKNPVRLGGAGLVLCAALAACDQTGPVTPDTTSPVAPGGGTAHLAQLDCTARVKARTVRCAGETPSGPAAALIVGGQGSFVQLTGTNVAYDGGAGTFSFDANVQNLIPQALGTTDGVTADADGVQVFFYVDPHVTDGTGAVDVANEDGTGDFMGTGEAFFRYAGILAPNQTSGNKSWQFSVDAGVESFAFKVLVRAAVQYPDGWVDLSPAADTMVAGGTQQLTATVRDVVGRTVATSVGFTSSNAAAASVDGAGLVTGAGVGSATITATSGARTGKATIAVCPDLAVGQTYTATMPAAANLCFAGGASASAEYTYIPVNFSPTSALSLTFTGSGILTASTVLTDRSPVGPSLLRTPSASRQQADEDWHRADLARQASETRGLLRDPKARVAPRSRGVTRGPRGLITVGVPAVGDLMSLNIASGCTGARSDRAARVVSVGTHVIVVADTLNPAGGFTTAQYDSIAAEFDTLAYPTDTANFGAPTDLDQNQRVVAFYTSSVNALTPPGSGSYVGGYVNARDLFSAEPTSCTRSNEGEIFYMLVPDPAGTVNSNPRSVAMVRSGTVGTLAHEFQHMINAGRRIYINDALGYEEVWLNEGLSHIAEELMFYRVGAGLAPRQNIKLSDLTTGPNASRRVAAFNTYLSSNFGRFQPYLQRPDTAGALKTNDVLATRGATWAFLRYAADRRNGDDQAFWQALVNSQQFGVANIQGVLGQDPYPWVRDFIAALYVDDRVSAVAPQYTIASFNFPSIFGGLGGTYPLGIRNPANGTGLTLNYSRGGGAAMIRFGVPTSGFASVAVRSGGAIPTSPYSMIVVRTK